MCTTSTGCGPIVPEQGGNDRGPRPPVGDEGLARADCRYRQRMDMTSPMTMAPKPMAKFHTPIDTMNGILSPAT